MNVRVLASAGARKLRASDFRLVSRALPVAAVGELLCRTMYVAIDPPALPVGAIEQLVPGTGVVEVVQSNVAEYVPGDVLVAPCGWQMYSLQEPDDVYVPRPGRTLTELLSVRADAGRRAFCLIESLAPGSTDTLVAGPSSAGLVALQLAHLRGARCVALVGSRRVAQALADLPLAAVVVRSEAGWSRALQAACPGGIQFWLTDASLPPAARVAAAGAQPPALAPARVVDLQVAEHHGGGAGLAQADRIDTALRTATGDGRLIPVEDITHGLQAAPAALLRLLAGELAGRCIVRVDP